MIAVVEHGRKVSSATRRALRDAVRAAGLSVLSWATVSKARKAKAAAADAVGGGADTVVVCGGDGTVRAAAEAVVDTGVALAVLPTGTANLFASCLNLPADPSAVVEAVVSGRRRVLDTGVCNDLTFTVMAGTGLDAGMIDEADAAGGLLAKDRLGVLSYVRAGVSQARDVEPFGAWVWVDEKLVHDGPVTCVLIANLGTLPGGLQAFPDASADDGLLDVGVVTAAGLGQWASVIVSTVRRRQELSPHVELTQGHRIDVRLDGEHRFELDGGTKGTTNLLRVRVRPASLLVCVPRR